MSKIIDRKACPKCREQGNDNKGDNLKIYDDNHVHCFACGYHINDLNNQACIRNEKDIIDLKDIGNWDKPYIIESMKFIGNFQAIEGRKISLNTCALLGILKGIYKGKEAYKFTLNNCVRVRIEPKNFKLIHGSYENSAMLGLPQAKDYSKIIIITEGEFDTASCYEVGYQACSLFSGNGTAKKSIMICKEELLKYKEIWWGGDNDAPGKKALKDAQELIRIDHIIDWGDYKDANEVLIKSNLKELLDNQVVNKEVSRPEGLVFGSELDSRALQECVIKTIPIMYPELQKSMGGFDYGCLYLILAGVGAGKTTFLTEIGLYLYDTLHLKVANMFYEENEAVTPLRYLGLRYNIPVGKLRRDRTLLTEQQWQESAKWLEEDRIIFLDKSCKRDSTILLKHIEYLVTEKSFDVIIIDHISYIIGRSGVSKNGERRDIDELLYQLQDIVQRLGCIIIAVSHIVESNGTKGWDEGEVPSLYSGRGSKVLAQVPDGIIGLARNMKNEYQQSVMDVYNLKNRWGGKLGRMDKLIFKDDTGRLELL